MGRIYGIETSTSSGTTTNTINAQNGVWYGTCTTAAGTAAKVVTLTDSTGFTLQAGTIVAVKFTYANTASNPTLNVASSGAKSIKQYGTTAVGNGNQTTGWIAGAIQIFVYDGTNWIRDYWANTDTTYTNASLGQGYGTCTTAAATTTKAVTLSNYVLVTGGIVSVKFTYAVPAGATLNVNSKGAKAIYHRGAAITANTIGAGDTATFIYNGSQYHLLSVDKKWSDYATQAALTSHISDFEEAVGTLQSTMGELPTGTSATNVVDYAEELAQPSIESVLWGHYYFNENMVSPVSAISTTTTGTHTWSDATSDTLNWTITTDGNCSFVAFNTTYSVFTNGENVATWGNNMWFEDETTVSQELYDWFMANTHRVDDSAGSGVSWSDISGRPILDTITWDLDPTDRVTIDVLVSMIFQVKVSDAVLTPEDFVNGGLLIENGTGELVQHELTSSDIGPLVDASGVLWGYALGGYGMSFIKTGTCTDSEGTTLIIEETGTYFQYLTYLSPAAGTTSLTLYGSDAFGTPKLQDSYMPDLFYSTIAELQAQIVTLASQVVPHVVGTYVFNDTMVAPSSDIIIENLKAVSIYDANTTYASNATITFRIFTDGTASVYNQSTDEGIGLYYRYTSDEVGDNFTVNFGDTPQLVSKTFYSWILANTDRAGVVDASEVAM